jgi:hypothetical protein
VSANNDENEQGIEAIEGVEESVLQIPPFPQ